MYLHAASILYRYTKLCTLAKINYLSIIYSILLNCGSLKELALCGLISCMVAVVEDIVVITYNIILHCIKNTDVLKPMPIIGDEISNKPLAVINWPRH